MGKSALALALLMTACWVTPLRAGPADRRLDIYWIDVEGGGATLIVTPAGESVLIDSGNPGDRDAGRIFDAATRVAGLKRIDHLVTTHYHVDHFGGAAPLAALMPITNVYDNGDFKEGWQKPGKEYLEFTTERRVVLDPGEEIPLKPGPDGAPAPRIRCLGTRQKFVAPPAGAPAAPADCADARKKRPDNTDNANSIVLLLEFGPFRFFGGGDLTWNAEAHLACPVDLVGPVDVYQVNHHGLDVSNNPLLVSVLSPTVAVMGNGTTKGCGPETFATLRATPSVRAIYQLHRNLRPDGATVNTDDALIANDAEACKGDFVKLSADPRGEAYTVGIPAKRSEQTYRTKRAAGR